MGIQQNLYIFLIQSEFLNAAVPEYYFSQRRKGAKKVSFAP